jgi:recombination protein RecA
MSKKKESATTAPDSFTERIYKSVEADYGKGVLISGQVAADEPRMVIPMGPCLDIITGGLLDGSWVGITGNPKTTKTNLALWIARQCQRPEYGNRKIYYGKVEGRLSIAHLKGIAGLDLNRINIIQSIEGKILTAQDYLRIFEKILRDEPRCVLLIDSVSALCDEREMTGGVGTETRGSGAKLFSQWLNTMSNVVPVNKSIVVGITHLMCNTGGMGAQYIEKASRRWHYQCDYQLRTLMKTAWKTGGEEGKQIGFIIKWACNASPLCPPGQTIESYVRFGTGVDALFEALNLGTACGLVAKSGAWYSLPFVPDSPKVQGAEAIYQLLIEHPDWAKELQKKVMEMATGVPTGASE